MTDGVVSEEQYKVWVEVCYRLLIVSLLEYWTDEGLPTGASRDGPLNTNNYAESGFRTIKTLFLGGMKNKRSVYVVIFDMLWTSLLKDKLKLQSGSAPQRHHQ